MDVAAQAKVRCKLTETWATNHRWQVLRRVGIFVVIAFHLWGLNAEIAMAEAWTEGKEGEHKDRENNKGLGKRQYAEYAICMHTETTCVLPTAVLYMRMIGKLPMFQSNGCWCLSSVSHAHYLCCYSHYSWCWATHKPDFTCELTLSPHVWMFPLSERANTNLSAVVVLAEKVPVTPPQKPAQLKLLFHAHLKGKLPLLSFWLTPKDLGSNLVYLHKTMHHTLSFSVTTFKKKTTVIHRNLVFFQIAKQKFTVDVYRLAFIWRVLFQKKTLNLQRIWC